MMKTIANDFSDVIDVCNGLIDAAVPLELQPVSDLPSKVQFLFLGFGPTPGTEALEVGLKNRLEGYRPTRHIAAAPMI
jgi:hypothetical protein